MPRCNDSAQPQKAEFDGELWFFTQRSSEKGFDVQKERQVNVAYASPENKRYVSISGRAKSSAIATAPPNCGTRV